MILADKIMNLRKKNGWSQEELADKMQVSRQAVSKWEGAQTMPDLEKILALSKLFGVTTDYLLKDEIEDEAFTDKIGRAPVHWVSAVFANEFLDWRKRASKYIATATLLCIVSIIPLLLLFAAAEAPEYLVSESLAEAVGLAALFVFVAVAVAIFVSCGFKNAPFKFIDKEFFELEHGVSDMVDERQKAFRSAYVKYNIIALCLCVLSPIPLFVGSALENEFLIVVMLAVTLLASGSGAFLFILAGVQWASMQKLLKKGPFARREQKKVLIKMIYTIYWLTATAVYLIWSFLTNDWEITWIVWPIAGILFAILLCVCNLLLSRETDR